jgi:hypothetical protein
MSIKKQPAEDWLQALFFKRSMGRRMLPESVPPYATGEGLILNNRRSRDDRRKAIGPKPTPTLTAV